MTSRTLQSISLTSSTHFIQESNRKKHFSILLPRNILTITQTTSQTQQRTNMQFFLVLVPYLALTVSAVVLPRLEQGTCYSLHMVGSNLSGTCKTYRSPSPDGGRYSPDHVTTSVNLNNCVAATNGDLHVRINLQTDQSLKTLCQLTTDNCGQHSSSGGYTAHCRECEITGGVDNEKLSCECQNDEGEHEQTTLDLGKL